MMEDQSSLREKMQVGDYTYGHGGIRVRSWGEGAQLRIGKFCSVGAGVTVYLGGNHRHDWITTFPFGHIHQHVFPHHGQGHPSTRGDVVIGNDVWLGEHCIIMSGVTIGDGAVVASGSHVVKDVAPYCIVGGNPATLIRQRFPDETVAKLLQMRWWDLPEDQIRALVPTLCAPPT